MKLGLAGKNAVISGASKGIGRGVADANVVAFAASERASYLSGIVINVERGHGARGGSFSR